MLLLFDAHKVIESLRKLRLAQTNFAASNTSFGYARYARATCLVWRPNIMLVLGRSREGKRREKDVRLFERIEQLQLVRSQWFRS